ncbi:MAG: arsenosugar biosynthesis radical SAM protein ArsS [Gammaproteobacteria bacterium]|nr:arsenosugar biosynthesis radical SAM protein ArsS [Gammaproteobacteria bacterium]
MHETLQLLQSTQFPPIRRRELTTLQANLGYKCNQSCLHCHVNASPKRREVMSRETIDQLLMALQQSTATTLDMTGGAPELNPDFRYLVEKARQLGTGIIDRCNLTILSEPGQEDLAGFLARHQVEVVASMPCYLEENVDAQRGDGVFLRSIKGLQQLNALGYGITNSGLVLNLVYNPQGASLPPPQSTLEQDYKKHLLDNYGIQFNRLLTITNMPIKRFGSTLVSRGEFEDYMQLLKSSHVEANVDAVMCRDLISIDWQGYIYDCDFNQMLKLPMQINNQPKPHIRDLLQQEISGLPIIIADHCYGCTAGQGSSCGGALE